MSPAPYPNGLLAGTAKIAAKPARAALYAEPEEVEWMKAMQANLARNTPYAKPLPSYQTALAPPEEQQFLAWVAANKVPFNPRDPVQDYDMRGYWRASQAGQAPGTEVNKNDGKPHFPDTFKTPYHQSFSAESMYALPTAPVWANDHQLVDPKTGRIVFDEKPKGRRR